MHSVALGEISTPITKGATPTTYGFEWQASGVPFLRSECVSEKGLDMRQSMFISSAAHASLQRSQVVEGDILLTITGNIGRVVQLEGIEEANINQHIARVRVIDERLHPRYVFHYLSQRVVRRYYESITTGQAYPQISLAQVQSTSIPLISKIEQKEIVAALDDADKLINSLERLISKKQAIKQGMMQELLTGRTRLPGFNRPWHEKLLGDLTRIKTGSRNNQDKVSSGAYPFFVRSQTVERIDTYSYSGEAVLIPGEGGIGEIFHYINGCHEVHQRVYRISDFSGISGKFAFYYLQQFFKDHALRNTVKATVDSIRLPIIQSFKMTIPGSIDEQTAIAALLDDTSSEIDALERRLESARNIKHGMMQELFSGRTRLPVEEVSS